MERLLIIVAAFALCIGCKDGGKSFIDENINYAEAQYEVALKIVDEYEEENGEIRTPFTIEDDESIEFVNEKAWVGGFFPGSMWYMYELTGDEKYAQEAQKLTEAISGVQYIT
ncbi:MAG: glucuronyl hydrolase, partial [Alistipes sp.]|nr:glucuronyl hydrolase [Candidatus Minthomonas equi]